ncbi:MAG: hypothetical protein WC846_01005 [Candidatus Gracilibacteria bacterium]|jgi:hypothetical protein
MTDTPPPLENHGPEADGIDAERSELMRYFLRLVLEADVDVKLPDDLRQKVTRLIGETFPFGVDAVKSGRKELETAQKEFGQGVLAVTDEHLFELVKTLFEQESFAKVFQLPHDEKALEVARREFKVDPMRMAGLFMTEFFSRKLDPALMASVLLSAGVEAGVYLKYKELFDSSDVAGLILFLCAVITAVTPFMWEEIRAKTLAAECGRRTSPLYEEIRRYNELLRRVTEAPDKENILRLLNLRREAEKHMFTDKRDRLAEEVRDISVSVSAKVEVAGFVRCASEEVDGTSDTLKIVHLAALRQRNPQS